MKNEVIVNQGGSRSGKTYAILQVIICRAMERTGETFTIARKELSTLRTTAMRDFIDILKEADLYDEAHHNKSENTYMLNGNRIEFIGMDKSQKKRGAKRSYLFCNEINELSKDDWMQLEIRTTKQIWCDFNPSDEYHFVYTDIIPRAAFIKSTYLDNPFLEDRVVERIERLKDTDPTAWTIYGLGEKAARPDLIYKYTEAEVPKEARLLGRGCDFGFTNDPTTLIDVYIDGDNLYMDERLYRTDMTNEDINRAWKGLDIDMRQPIICDSADPKSIETLYRMGWNVKPANKGGKDNVLSGIQLMKTFHIHATPTSHNLIKELRNYRWKQDKEGRNVNIPVDGNDHGLDAARYCVFTHLHSKVTGKYHLR